MKNIAIAVGIISLISAVIVVAFLPRLQSDVSDKPFSATDNSLFTQSADTPTPTIYTFYEITIPYLRARIYSSNLGDLAQVSQNSNYTSYLTSYDSDGLQINGLLTKPRGDMPDGGFPAVVFIHGYIPPAQYKTLVNYSSYVDYLARYGFVVFKIDLRGHADSRGEPGGAYFSADYIIDTLNARAALAASDFVNPQKIGLWGHSMAGNVVMRSFTVMPEIPAVVVWAGAVYTYADQIEYGINDGSYQQPSGNSQRLKRRQLLRETHGDFNPDSPFWQAVAVTNYLSDLRGAVQIHHAINDNVVDIGYSRNLMRLLEQTSVLHELYEYSSGGHNLTGSAFSQAMQRTVDFFRKSL